MIGKLLRKKIAKDIFDKMCDMGSCPNERDIVVDIIEHGKRTIWGGEHCTTDCWCKDCQSYAVKPKP